MRINISHNRAGNLAGIMHLLKIATHDDPANELYRKITPSEMALIYAYGEDKGISREDINGLKLMFDTSESFADDRSSSDIKRLGRICLDELCLADNLKRSFGDHIAENQLSFMRVKDYAEMVFTPNRRLDPEELRLLEGILSLENYMTPKKHDKFLELIKDYNKGRKVFLLVHGLTNEISGKMGLDYYTNEFNKAGFDVSAFGANLRDDKGHKIVDRNHLGRPNMVIFAPYSYPPETRYRIIKDFNNLAGSETIPRLAVDTEPGDIPNKFNVHTVLPIGIKMPAILEEVAELYRRFYEGQHENGK